MMEGKENGRRAGDTERAGEEEEGRGERKGSRVSQASGEDGD